MLEWLKPWLLTSMLLWSISFIVAYKDIPIKSRRGLMFWILYAGFLSSVAAIIVVLPKTIIGVTLGLLLGYVCLRVLRTGVKYVKSGEE